MHGLCYGATNYRSVLIQPDNSSALITAVLSEDDNVYRFKKVVMAGPQNPVGIKFDLGPWDYRDGIFTDCLIFSEDK